MTDYLTKNLDDLKTYEDWIFLNDKVDVDFYELIDGELVLMSGASIRHGKIALNIGSSLHRQFGNGPCYAVVETLSVRVKNEFSDNVFRPDLTVDCNGEREDGENVINDPTFVVEILSKSTALKDRTIKLENYLNIDELKGYLIVNQEFEEIEWFRLKNGKIVRSVYGKNDVLVIPNLLTLTVEEIYRNVFKKVGR